MTLNSLKLFYRDSKFYLKYLPLNAVDNEKFKIPASIWRLILGKYPKKVKSLKTTKNDF